MGEHHGNGAPITEKLRLSLAEAASLTAISANGIRDLERKGEFPPRIAVPTGKGSKKQFIAREVEAFANGLDWRALVAERGGSLGEQIS